MRSKSKPANTLTSLLMGLAALIACVGQAACEAPQKPGVAAKEPIIEGTYKLVSRDLPNGKKQGPPDVLGLLTYTKEYRNVNNYVKRASVKTRRDCFVRPYAL